MRTRLSVIASGMLKVIFWKFPSSLTLITALPSVPSALLQMGSHVFRSPVASMRTSSPGANRRW